MGFFKIRVQSKGINRLDTKIHIALLLVFGLATPLFGQVPPDSLVTIRDTVPPTADTLRPVVQNFKLSKDSLDGPVEYNAQDSMRYDIRNKQIHLYGNASVKYTSILLKANYIIFDWDSNTVTAEGTLDSLGQPAGVPEFSDKSTSQDFQSKKMRYNFKTKKGVIYEAVSVQKDVFVRSEKGKFIGGITSADSTKADDIIYSKNAIFTSCELPHPHYGIKSYKQKVVPGKTVVVGPSILEIGGVPTPIALPFGFFPITSKATAGLIFPKDYIFDNQVNAFGLSNLGFFTPLGEHFNLSVTGDVFFNSRWGLHVASQYRKRYKYNGNFQADFGTLPIQQSDGKIVKNNSFSFKWAHNQDQSAHPTINFGGNVGLQTQDYQRRFQNDFNSVTQNQLNSNFSFRYNPTGRPWNFAAALNTSQNTATREVAINFPTLNFQTQTINPFKRKNRTGPPKWYENIALRYQAEAKNKYIATDTTLFEGNIIDSLQYGVRQSANTDVTLNFLKYFRLTPNVNYSETWYFQTLEKTFDPTTVITFRDTLFNSSDSSDFMLRYDTLYGRQLETIMNDFKPFRQFTAGIGLGFDLYGTVLFKKGKLKGLRHVFRPNFSFNYAPDYTDPKWGYRKLVDTDNRPDKNNPTYYSVFEDNQVYGSPSIAGEQAALSYSFSNLFQAKYLSKKDSTVKYLNLMDNLSISGSYNFIADSFKFSPVSVSGRATLLKRFLEIRFSATFDPYAYDETGKRLKVLSWDKNRRPLEFVNATLPFNNSLSIGTLRSWINGDAAENETPSQPPADRREAPQDFWELCDNFTFNHNITFQLQKRNGRDTFLISANSLQLRGDLQITKNWSIQISNVTYDFVNKRLAYPEIGFSRDLHCWDMGLTWQPERGTYSFYLRVKPNGTLSFIEVPYQRRNNNFGGF